MRTKLEFRHAAARRRGAGPKGGPTGPAGRIFGSLFFLAFLGMGSFFLVLLGQEVTQRAAPYGWDAAECRILASEVATDAGDSKPYLPAIEYAHEWWGETRHSRQVRRDDASYGDYADAQAVVNRYPADTLRSCWVSAEGEAVLERGGLWVAAFVLLPLVFIAVGVVGIVACWRNTPADARGQAVQQPISKRASGRAGARTALAFGSLFAVIGVGIAWPLLAKPLYGVFSARTWETHACVVERSKVRTHRGDEGNTYSVDILYRYDAAGAARRSNRYSFFGGSSSGRSGKADIVLAHPVGAEVTCWVDPANAEEAVLERGLTAHAFLGVIPLAFVFVGGLIAWAGQRKQRRFGARSAGSGRDAPSEARLAPTGPIELEASASPTGRLVLVTFACVFWNGIVSVFLRAAFENGGGVSVFILLFMIPFVLVGIALIFGVAHSVLALRNPIPRVTASNDRVALGERLELAWHLSGRVERLEHLRIYLEGTEEAEYRRGTNTYTDREVFATIELAESRDVHTMRSGTTVLEMPRDTMHSFEADHNRVVWQLRFEGEIPRWPDVGETFPIEVVPMSPGRLSEEAR